MAGPLKYLLITVNVVGLEKVYFNDTKILRLFLNILTVKDKHYLLNRDNSTQPIQLQLSEKQKTFNELFFPFLKSILNLKQLPKKDDPHR